MSSGMKVSVSQIFKKEGKRYAFVTFSDGIRTLEIRIPEGTVISGQEHFSEDEIAQMQEYLTHMQDTIWDTAKGINSMSAFMK